MAEARKAAGDSGSPLSVCLFCGSSQGPHPDFMEAAAAFGRRLAADGVRLVYGGGGVGLMGAASKAAHGAGGAVLGVMPAFLRGREALYDEVETIVVESMHERKRLMFEQSDAFAVFPGGIGTLEEVVELMSWRRLDLHRKPIVFLNLHGFWRPFMDMMAQSTAQTFTPAWLSDTWRTVEAVDDVLPAIRELLAQSEVGPGFHGYSPDADIAAKL